MASKKRAPRPALAFAPTLHTIEPGRDAYVTSGHMRQLLTTAGESETAPVRRWWTFHDMPTTVELTGGKTPTYAKLLDRFTDHMEDTGAFLELLREYADNGVPRPGGYADVFHESYKSPRIPWSVNATLAPAFAGGWQQAIKVGLHPGRHYRYDMRSAYLWAGSLGMPDPVTYRRHLRPSPDTPGVYRVQLARPVVGAPFPFDRAREVLASSEEIEVYSLPVARVLAGYSWSRTLDPAPLLEAVRRVSTWKQAGRSYWGRWGQTARVQCHAGGRAWTLPNIAANVPWAHTIVSRVKMRLWESSSDAVHVYVDSVITPHQLRTGGEIGDWKLEKVYPAGVVIRGPGQYGDAQERRLERMAGVPKGSRLRDRMADNHPELLAG